MVFNSIDFLVFFSVVCFVYFILPKKICHLWLLIASYYFYMCWNAKYAVLIFVSTFATYISGITLQKMKREKKEKKHIKRVIVLCVVVNLCILFYFKYANFAISILQSSFRVIHINLAISDVDVLLPVGISFYTFQALSYAFDVYNGRIEAEKNFFRYALFVSFFPQLVAGPIERSKNLLDQLKERRDFNFENARVGFLIMLWGFFLKIVIADRAALFVDTVYGDYTKYGGFYLIAASVLFAIQIYCDFLGYSNIAIGAAEILNIKLMENFEAPYLSTSIAEFWRRWHISLTSWFRDYVYIPLGGNRKGTIRKYINMEIVFLLSGLWHGADLSYVAWGGVNGAFQIVGEILTPFRNRLVQLLHLQENSLGHRILKIICTFCFVDFAWIFFRAGGIREAIAIIKSIFTIYNPWILFDGSIYNCGLDRANFSLLIICIGILLLADYCRYKAIVIRKIVISQDYWFRWLFVCTSIWVILLFGLWGPSFENKNFIYFQF